jgi:hypothetical protein
MNRRSQLAVFEVAYFTVLLDVIWLVHVSLTKAHGPHGWMWNIAALLAVVAFGIVLALRPRLAAILTRRT